MRSKSDTNSATKATAATGSMCVNVPDISTANRIDVIGVFTDAASVPATCQAYVKRLEELSGCRISVIGTGPQRDHVIQINSLVD